VEKGEQSGNVQAVREIRLDCDEDVVLLRVEQGGGSPATREGTAVFSEARQRALGDGRAGDQDPKEIYGR